MVVSQNSFVPLKLSELVTAKIAPALSKCLCPELLHLFPEKVVFPVNVRVLLRAVIPHPNLHKSVNDSDAQNNY